MSSDSESDDDDFSRFMMDSGAGNKKLTGALHTAKCKHCAKLPFASQRFHPSALGENDVLWDFEQGIYELIHRMNHLEADNTRLMPNVAGRVAEKAISCTKRVQKHLLRAGLMHGHDQNFTANDVQDARIVAPFRLEEINMGPLLGTGGFSCVYEIIRFEPDETMDLDPHVHDARRFLQENAQRPLLYKASDKKKPAGGKKTMEKTIARYAIKHLRQGLAADPERFERAAVDLSLEAQLLLVMDHPNM